MLAGVGAALLTFALVWHAESRGRQCVAAETMASLDDLGDRMPAARPANGESGPLPPFPASAPTLAPVCSHVFAAGPTFEDLAMDESLDDPHRIVRYGTSAIALQRLVHVRMLADTAAAYGSVGRAGGVVVR